MVRCPVGSYGAPRSLAPTKTQLGTGSKAASPAASTPRWPGAQTRDISQRVAAAAAVLNWSLGLRTAARASDRGDGREPVRRVRCPVPRPLRGQQTAMSTHMI